jgi:hypothetical protein
MVTKGLKKNFYTPVPGIDIGIKNGAASTMQVISLP